MSRKVRIGIVGGGIVGLASAWKLATRFPNAEIHLFEKESAVGLHQSSHNSGVLHCGLYYRPGSLKARLAVEGIREMTKFCLEHEIPHEICGKLVVATNEREVSRLEDLESRGKANGLSGVRRLCREGILEREPHAAGISALEVPEEGIVDYPRVCEKLADLLRVAGHSIHLDHRVLSGTVSGGKVRLQFENGGQEMDFVVNCGGLHSDRVCKIWGGNPEVKIIPFRGEYYRLKEESASLVKHLIYPVPDPAFPFLGVHFSRLIHGGVEAGPNAVLAMSREGYTKKTFNLRDVMESIAFRGLWKFGLTYRKMCIAEIRQSLSRERFCRSLQKLVPSITESDLEEGGAGVRAQAMNRSGALVEDFSMVESERMLHVLNAPSPAATASLAIGNEIASRVELL